MKYQNKTIYVLVLGTLFSLPLSAQESERAAVADCRSIADKAHSPSSPVRLFWDQIASCMSAKGFRYSDKCNSGMTHPTTGAPILTGAELPHCYEPRKPK